MTAKEQLQQLVADLGEEQASQVLELVKPLLQDNARRLELLLADPATALHGGGVLVIDDSAYGDQDGFRAELAEAGLPFVMALKPRRGTWAYGPGAYTPADAARTLAWHGPMIPATGSR